MIAGRSRFAITGAVVVAAYIASAALSAHLSPIAGRPLLDGLAPPEPYRWADPPTELEPTNRPPTPGSFRVPLGPLASRTAVFTTDDAQVTVILAEGTFEPVEGARAVRLTIEPVSPAEVERPEPPLEIVGNVVRLRASYLPSGDPVRTVGKRPRVVLTYPFSAGQHGGHSVIQREAGAWVAVETNDLPSIQQADGLIDALGDVAVAVDRSAAPGGSPGGGGNRVATVGLVAGIVILALVAAWLIGRPLLSGASRSGRGADTGSRPRR